MFIFVASDSVKILILISKAVRFRLDTVLGKYVILCKIVQRVSPMTYCQTGEKLRKNAGVFLLGRRV